MPTLNDPSPAADSPDLTHSTAPHAGWIAAARAEVARCAEPSADTSSSRADGAPDSPANLRVLLGERYELGDEIRRGGQGVVYRGVQRGTRRDVAIKVMFGGGTADPAGRARFEREAQILAQLRHPNIVTIHESGGAANSLYYVMDFIPGEPLDEHIRAQGGDPRAIAALFVKICDAVNIAHLRGVIHRDLKPSNIRVDPTGEPHVLDFGLAKISSQLQVAGSRPPGASATDSAIGNWQLAAGDVTETGQFLGSVPWASPEQVAARPDEMDLRTDVYSLGVMLYQFLTGHFPYPVNGPVRSVLENICNFEPKNPAEVSKAVSDDLGQIVLKCLRKRPDDRYQTAGDVARELRRFLAGEPIEAKRDQTWYMLRKRLRRYRTFTLVSSLLVLLVLGSLIALTAFYREEHRLRTAAEIAQKEAEAARAETSAALNAAERAQKDEERQRRLAEKHAEETRKVAQFQAEQMTAIDPELMGRGIQERMRAQVESGLERQSIGQWPERRKRSGAETAAALAAYDELALAAHPADVARRVMDEFVLRPAADALEQRFADQPLVVAQIRDSIGMAYESLGLYSSAEPHLRSALEIRLRELGDSDVLVAGSQFNLASVRKEQGDYAAAEALYTAALATLRARLGGSHADVARTLSAIGELLRARGDFPRAVEYHREALALERELPGDHSVELSTCLHNLAFVLDAQNQYEEAESLYREGIGLLREKGEESPLLAASLNGLAGVLRHQARYAAAESYYQEALALTRKRLGDEHPQIATILNDLALLRRSRGDFTTAESLFRDSLALTRRLLGDEHPDVASTLDNLGGLLSMRGDLIGAEPLYREALAIRQSTLDPDHPDIATTLHNLGALSRDKGDFAAAESFYRESLRISRARLGDEHVSVAATLNNLGVLLDQRGDYVAAEAVFREALAICIKRLAPNHVGLAYTRVGLARALLAIGRLDETEELIRATTAAVPVDDSMPSNLRGTICDVCVKLYDALQAITPDRGHETRAAEWRKRQAEWRATTQPEGG